jgi:hypothetical protein
LPGLRKTIVPNGKTEPTTHAPVVPALRVNGRSRRPRAALAVNGVGENCTQVCSGRSTTLEGIKGSHFAERVAVRLLLGQPLLTPAENPLLNQLRAKSDAMVEIVLKHLNRCPADRRLTHEQRPLPPEMPRPFVPPWIEQRMYLLRFGIDTRDVRSLMSVARKIQ